MPAPSRSPRRLSIQRVYRQSFSHIAARRQLPLNSTHGLPVQAIRKNENQSNNQQPRWNSACSRSSRSSASLTPFPKTQKLRAARNKADASPKPEPAPVINTTGLSSVIQSHCGAPQCDRSEEHTSELQS